MAIRPCSLCSGEAQWDDGAQSIVCFECGYLEDSSQTSLVEHVEYDSAGHGNYRQHDVFNALSTPTLRAASGRVLAGQSSKANHDVVKSREMHNYIISCLRVLKFGNTERVMHLFDMAMYRAQYRWGRQARLAAAACIAIAFHESGKGDAIVAIADVVSETIPSISKVYTRISKILSIDIPRPDPALLMPTLQAHVCSLLKSDKKMPSKLHQYLAPLSPSQTLRSASQLSTLIMPHISIKHDLTSPIACAIFILALEGLSLRPCPDIQCFADRLGERFGGSGSGASKWCIMTRYNAILPLLLKWKLDIPWCQIDADTRKRKSDRIEVALALSDVIQFRDQLRSSKQAAQQVGPFEDVSRGILPTDLISLHGETSTHGTSANQRSKRRHESEELPIDPSKRPRVRPKSVDDISSFLLSPSEVFDWSNPKVTSLGHHLLKACVPEKVRMTRLQSLSALRISEGLDVVDEELFEEGELESMLRSDAEVQLLRVAMGWEEHVSLSRVAGLPTKPQPQQTCSEPLSDVSDNEEQETVEGWRPLSPSSVSLSVLADYWADTDWS